MAWLALATTLFLWSAFTAPSKSVDLPAILSGVCIAALIAGAFWVYPPRSELLALLAGIAAAAIAIWMAPAVRHWARWAALSIGLCAGLFALLGPAQGLFP